MLYGNALIEKIAELSVLINFIMTIRKDCDTLYKKFLNIALKDRHEHRQIFLTPLDHSSATFLC